MTEREPVVISNVEELIAESLKPGGEPVVWAHPPDEEGVVPEPETTAVQPINNESAQAGVVTEQHSAEEARTPAQMPIGEQIATDDSDVVATVRDDEPLDTYLHFLKGEANPNLPTRQPLKPFGNIFNRVTPRLPRRSLRPGFSTGD